MDVAIYKLKGNGGSAVVCPAMHAGALKVGHRVTVFDDTQYVGAHAFEYDVAVFWGYVATLQAVMNDFKAAGKQAIYIDAGYWQRQHYHKVAVNSRHPTEYFQNKKHGPERRNVFGLTLQPWSEQGRHILLAGMGAKAAWAEKLEPVESFEKGTIATLRQYTDLPIIYRPKPSWTDAKPIESTIFSPPSEPLDRVLLHCHAVVTHHSNVAVDGLIAGIPAFVLHGVAKPMGLQDLSQIEYPRRQGDREQWLNDVAYCQWSTQEMRDGTVWRYLKDEGLIP